MKFPTGCDCECISQRANGMIWCESITDSKVWMREEDATVLVLPGSSVSEKRGCPGGRTVRGSRKRCDPALERQREPESHRCETDVKK